MKVLRILLPLCIAVTPFLMLAAEAPPANHVAWMKEAAGLAGKLRMGEDVQASAERLAAVFKEVEGFWASRSEVGAKATKDIQAAAMSVASHPNDAEAVAADMKAVGASCGGCHRAHREGEAPNFMIK